VGFEATSSGLKISVLQGTANGSHALVYLLAVCRSASKHPLHHSLLPPCRYCAYLSSRSLIMALANHGTTLPPSNATDAVLKPSEPVPEGSREVQGIDFNDYAERAITVEELVEGYASMGFQATAVGEAVRIVNDMVSGLRRPQATVALGREPLGLRLRETPAIPALLRLAKRFSRNGQTHTAVAGLVMRLMFPTNN
jgi:hypothetical protein